MTPAEKLRFLFTYNPLTGLFHYNFSRGKRKAGDTAGGLSKDNHKRKPARLNPKGALAKYSGEIVIGLIVAIVGTLASGVLGKWLGI